MHKSHKRKKFILVIQHGTFSNSWLLCEMHSWPWFQHVLSSYLGKNVVHKY